MDLFPSTADTAREVVHAIFLEISLHHTKALTQVGFFPSKHTKGRNAVRLYRQQCHLFGQRLREIQTFILEQQQNEPLTPAVDPDPGSNVSRKCRYIDVVLQQVLHQLFLQGNALIFLENPHPFQISSVCLECAIDLLVFVLVFYTVRLCRQAAGQFPQGLIIQLHHRSRCNDAHCQEHHQKHHRLLPDPTTLPGNGRDRHQRDEGPVFFFQLLL